MFSDIVSGEKHKKSPFSIRERAENCIPKAHLIHLIDAETELRLKYTRCSGITYNNIFYFPRQIT